MKKRSRKQQTIQRCPKRNGHNYALNYTPDHTRHENRKANQRRNNTTKQSQRIVDAKKVEETQEQGN